MRAGDLRHRVLLQRAEPGQDPESGAIVDRWVDVASVWAAIEYLSARDFIAAQAAQSQVVARIVIRFRSDVVDTMRILHGTKIYAIAGVLPDKETGREYLTLPCSQGVTRG